jgi:hypothetical protein
VSKPQCFSPLTLWHSTGVFIGNRGTARPCERHLDPQLPSLSPEYSLKRMLQRVITAYLITDSAQPTLPTPRLDAGPCYMGRIAHGPLPALRGTRPHGLRGAFVLACRSEGAERASVWTVSSVCPVEPVGAASVHAEREVDVVERSVACSPSPQQRPPACSD